MNRTRDVTLCAQIVSDMACGRRGKAARAIGISNAAGGGVMEWPKLLSHAAGGAPGHPYSTPRARVSGSVAGRL